MARTRPATVPGALVVGVGLDGVLLCCAGRVFSAASMRAATVPGWGVLRCKSLRRAGAAVGLAGGQRPAIAVGFGCFAGYVREGDGEEG